jgi:hypothetical protein
MSMKFSRFIARRPCVEEQEVVESGSCRAANETKNHLHVEKE